MLCDDLRFAVAIDTTQTKRLFSGAVFVVVVLQSFRATEIEQLHKTRHRQIYFIIQCESCCIVSCTQGDRYVKMWHGTAKTQCAHFAKRLLCREIEEEEGAERRRRRQVPMDEAFRHRVFDLLTDPSHFLLFFFRCFVQTSIFSPSLL